MLSNTRRLNLLPSNKEYLRFFCHIWYGDSNQSLKQVLPLVPENCKLDEERKVLQMTFKPPTSKSLKDCVYFFYGEGGYRSTIEFVMLNRKSADPQQVLLSEKPYQSSVKYTGYHFGREGGFWVKITTLGKTQLTHLAQFLKLPPDAFFQDSRSVPQGHKFMSAEDTSWYLTTDVKSSKNVAVGEIVEIYYEQSVDTIFSTAFGFKESEKKEQEM